MLGTPIFAFILLGIMLFAFAAIAFFFFVYDHRDVLYSFDDDPLMKSDSFECEFSRIGGSENEHTTIKFVCEKGKNKLFYSSRLTNGAPVDKKELDVPDEAAEKLKELYKKHCFPVLSDCEHMEEVLLDAPSELITYTVGEQSYMISSDQQFPEKSRGIFNEAEMLMRAYLE